MPWSCPRRLPWFQSLLTATTEGETHRVPGGGPCVAVGVAPREQHVLAVELLRHPDEALVLREPLHERRLIPHHRPRPVPLGAVKGPVGVHGIEPLFDLGVELLLLGGREDLADDHKAEGLVMCNLLR